MLISRQRCRARKAARTVRSTSASSSTTSPDTVETESDSDRRDRRPEVLQPLPVGLDLCRQHAVSPLEARDLSRRHQRPVHRPLAEGHSKPRARSARSTRTSSTWFRRCSMRLASKPPAAIAASRSRRSKASASPTHSTKPTRRPSTITQYFEMLGHRSLYHDGWRAVCPWPGTSFTESGRAFGAPIDARHAHRTRCERLGTL